MSKKPYAAMSEAERWDWHTDVYAFRRVMLGVPVTERTSPPDPEGKWYNADMVATAEAMKRTELARRAKAAAASTAAHNGWRQTPEGRTPGLRIIQRDEAAE